MNIAYDDGPYPHNQNIVLLYTSVPCDIISQSWTPCTFLQSTQMDATLAYCSPVGLCREKVFRRTNYIYPDESQPHWMTKNWWNRCCTRTKSRPKRRRCRRKQAMYCYSWIDPILSRTQQVMFCCYDFWITANNSTKGILFSECAALLTPNRVNFNWIFDRISMGNLYVQLHSMQLLCITFRHSHLIVRSILICRKFEFETNSPIQIAH